MNEEKNIIVSGFGGQGVLFLGTVLAHAAMIEGKNSTWIPNYGAEMRGGAANCYVVISKESIGSPIFDLGDFGIFLSAQAKDKFENMISKGGLILADSSAIKEEKKRDDVEYLFIPLNNSIHGKNREFHLNITTLGCFIKKTKILSKEAVIEALKKVSETKKPEFVKINLESFEFGYSLL